MKTLDPTLRILFLGLFAFTALLFLSEWAFPNDGEIFQVISNLMSGFSGALIMGIRKDLGLPGEDPPPARKPAPINPE